MKKRFFAMLLALVMVLGMVPSAVFASAPLGPIHAVTGEGVEFSATKYYQAENIGNYQGYPKFDKAGGVLVYKIDVSEEASGNYDLATYSLDFLNVEIYVDGTLYGAANYGKGAGSWQDRLLARAIPFSEGDHEIKIVPSPNMDQYFAESRTTALQQLMLRPAYTEASYVDNPTYKTFDAGEHGRLDGYQRIIGTPGPKVIANKDYVALPWRTSITPGTGHTHYTADYMTAADFEAYEKKYTLSNKLNGEIEINTARGWSDTVSGEAPNTTYGNRDGEQVWVLTSISWGAVKRPRYAVYAPVDAVYSLDLFYSTPGSSDFSLYVDDALHHVTGLTSDQDRNTVVCKENALRLELSCGWHILELNAVPNANMAAIKIKTIEKAGEDTSSYTAQITTYGRDGSQVTTSETGYGLIDETVSWDEAKEGYLMYSESVTLDNSGVQQIAVRYYEKGAQYTDLKGNEAVPFTANESDNFLVLPPYADKLTAVKGAILTGPSGSITIGEPGSAEDHATLQALFGAMVPAQRYDLTVIYPDGLGSERFEVMQSANLSSMFITLDHPEGVAWINSSKSHKDTGTLALVDTAGASLLKGEDLQTAEGPVDLGQIKGRGNASFNNTGDKKGYGVKFLDGVKYSMIDGANPAKSWVLLNNRPHDPSGMLNYLAYNFYSELTVLTGNPAVKVQPIDLYIDGAYRGCYFILEKINDKMVGIKTTEVDTGDEDPADKTGNIIKPVVVTKANAADDPAILAGITSYSYSAVFDEGKEPIKKNGFLLEIDSYYSSEVSYFVTRRNVPVTIKEPENASQKQVQDIAIWVQEFEDAFFSDTGYNSKGKHYSEYIDMESFAERYMSDAFMSNGDAFGTSSYLYTEGAGSVLKFGPAWDYDLSKLQYPTPPSTSDHGQMILAQLLKRGDLYAVVDQVIGRYKEITDSWAANDYASYKAAVDSMRPSQLIDIARWGKDWYLSNGIEALPAREEFLEGSYPSLAYFKTAYSRWFVGDNCWYSDATFRGVTIGATKNVGGTITFTADYVGATPTTYQWYKVDTRETIGGEANPDYMVKGIAVPSDGTAVFSTNEGGIYYCVATGKVLGLEGDKPLTSNAVTAYKVAFEIPNSTFVKQLYLTGDEITAPASPESGEKIFLGWFDADGNEFIEGTLATTSVTYTAKLVDCVAKIGDTKYGSLAAAIADAETSGDTIVLQTDVDITAEGITITGKSITLDLNGNEIKAANTDAGNITISGDAQLTLKDSTDTQKNGTGTGKIYSETDYAGTATGYGVIEVLGAFSMESGYIYTVRPDTANKGNYGVVVKEDGSVTVNGGKIEAGWHAISANDQKASDTTIKITGGDLSSASDYAIYHPQTGTLTISGESTKITGAAGGVLMNKGTLTISGGTVTSLGTGSTGNWTDGSGGAANAALNINAKYGAASAEITGGTFTAQGNALVLLEGSDNTGVITKASTVVIAAPSGYEWIGEGTQTLALKKYTVTYNANGGEGAPTEQTKTHGEDLALSSTEPTRTGYTFDCWNTQVDGQGDYYSAGANYTIDAAVTLYAQWTAKIYTITLNGNDATTNGTPSVTATYGSNELSTTIAAPTKTDYVFAGWTTGQDSGDVVIDKDGNLVANVSGYTDENGTWKNDSATVTLYAKWEDRTDLSSSIVLTGVIETNQEYDSDPVNYYKVAVVTGYSGLAAALEYKFSGREETTHADAVQAPTNAGKYTLTVSIPTGNAEYTGSASVNFEITQVELTPSIGGTLSKEYDGTTAAPNAVIVLTGTKVKEETPTATATVVYNSANVAEANTLSTENITLDEAFRTNYKLTATSATRSDDNTKITAKSISISAAVLEEKVYDGDGAVTVSSVTFSGEIVGHALTSGDYTVTGEFTDVNAGTANRTANVTVTLKDTEAAKNYTISSSPYQLTGQTIKQATITVTPDALSKKYGEVDPALTYTFTGAVEGEVPLFTGELQRTEGEAVADNYTITNKDLALEDNGSFKSANYTLVLVSTPVYFTITEADAPAAPADLVAVHASASGSSDGKITGLPGDSEEIYEYKLSTDENYTALDVGSTQITNLAPGTYYVRIKANGNHPAGAPATVKVLYKEAKPESASFAATGPDSGTLSNVSAGMKYKVNSGDWQNITGDTANITGLANGDTVWVMKPGVSETSVDSEAKEIGITKAAKPTGVSKVDCTSSGNTGKLTGVTTAMEYKLSTAESWTDGTGSEITSLAAGTYYVRVKATGTTLASDHEQYTIAAYTPPAPSIPSIPSGPVAPPAPTTTTETVTNPDGSVTTIVTNKTTGTVTETTKQPSGAALTVETRKDGTQSISVAVPANVDSATFTIPVEEVKPGTVVKDAATGEVMKFSVATEDSLKLQLEGNANLVIVDNSKEYVDTKDHWAEDAIHFVSSRELYQGVGNNTFLPKVAMTRGMLAQVLHNLEDNPDHAFDGSFSDLKDTWYTEAILWAAEKGIVNGIPGGAVEAERDITREEMVVMLWRYAGRPDSDHDLSGYGDSGKISDYAELAFAWANELGVINGKPGNLLDPKGTASRAEVAQMMMNFMNALLK